MRVYRGVNILPDTSKAPTINVGAFNTIPSNQSATVTNIGTDYDAIFDFNIPRGTSGFSETHLDWDNVEEITADETTTGNNTIYFTFTFDKPGLFIPSGSSNQNVYLYVSRLLSDGITFVPIWRSFKYGTTTHYITYSFMVQPGETYQISHERAGGSAYYNFHFVPLKDYTTYSTTERVVGTWIDGRPIYENVYVGALTNGQVLATNVDFVVAMNTCSRLSLYSPSYIVSICDVTYSTSVGNRWFQFRINEENDLYAMLVQSTCPDTKMWF